MSEESSANAETPKGAFQASGVVFQKRAKRLSALKDAKATLVLPFRRPGLASKRDLISQIELTEFDDRTVTAWRDQWKPPYVHPRGEVGMRWEVMFDDKSWRNELNRLDVAIWCGEELCGLVYGVLTKSKGTFKLKILEGCPLSNSSLRGAIAPIAVHACQAFAIGEGATEMHICEPYKGAIPTYRKLGFEPVDENPVPSYLVRRIG